MFARTLQKTLIVQRGFHTSGPKKSPFVNADSANSLNKVYHTTSIVLAALTPLPFLLDHSPLTVPFDLALGILLPFHSHVALNYVISDYVPKALRQNARLAVLAATVIATAGLLKLNLTGPGIAETIKSLWKKPATKN